VTHGAYSTATLQSNPPVQRYAVKAGVRQYRAKEIKGLIQQGDRKVRIAASDLRFTPKQNAQVVIGGKTYAVVSANTRRPFDEAAIHMCRSGAGMGKSFRDSRRPCGAGTALEYVSSL
jgi:hypothetical protein